MSEILYNKSFNENFISPEKLFNSYIENDSPNFILIVPTGKQVRKLSSEFIRDYVQKTGKPISPPKIFTLQTFTKFIFSKIEELRDKIFISESFQLELIDQAAKESELEYFFRNIKNIKSTTELNRNLLERILSIVYGIKEDGITPIKMELDFVENYSDITNETRYRDILKIYQNYQKLLKNTYMDYAESLNLINKVLFPTEIAQFNLFTENPTTENKVNYIFKKTDLILFYGFSEFKLPEIEFISKLTQSELNVMLNLDYNPKNGPIFGNLEDAVAYFQANNLKLKTLQIQNESEKNHFLRNYLFEAEQKNYLVSKQVYFEKSKLFEDSIQIISAKNKSDEVNAITKLCKYLILKEGINSNDICIASRRADSYSTEFRESFKIHNIPANISDRFKLETSRPINAIFSVLNLIMRKYQINDIIKVINSPYLNLNVHPDKELSDRINLIRVLKKYNIKTGYLYGGIERVIIKLNKQISLLEDIKSDKSANNLLEYELNSLNYEISEIKLAVSDLIFLKEIFSEIPKKLSLYEFANIIKEEIIGKFKLRQKITRNYYSLQERSEKLSKIEYFYLLDEIEKDSNAINEFTRILDEMVFLLQDRYKNYLPSFQELFNKLRITVSAGRYQIKEKSNYGVNITSLEQTRGFDYKVLILCGAIDGEMPISYSPEKFLGKALNNSDLRHFNSERMLFYQFLTNGNSDTDKKFYLFHPKLQDDEELIRSQFIDSLTYVAEIPKMIDLTNAKSLPIWYTAISSETELHEKIELDSIYEAKVNNRFNAIEHVNEFTNYYPEVILSELTQDYVESMINRENHIFSVSEIENYHSCPYKYFMQRVINISVEEPESNYLDSLESGTILHDIMYDFYIEMQKRQAQLNPGAIVANPISNDLPEFKPVKLEAKKKNEYLDLLFELARRKFNIQSDDEIYKFYAVQEYFSTTKRTGIIEFWLDYELQRVVQNWKYLPSLFEIGFDSKYTIKPVDLKKFKIKGKIDRLEVYSDDEAIKFLIADYKSGSRGIVNNKEIQNGEKFQMPLYIAAAKSILKEYYQIEAKNVGAVYYIFKFFEEEAQHSYVLALQDSSINAAKFPKNNFLPEESLDNDEVINNSIEAASAIIERIEARDFSIIPVKGDETCKYCKFSDICRINEMS